MTYIPPQYYNQQRPMSPNPQAMGRQVSRDPSMGYQAFADQSMAGAMAEQANLNVRQRETTQYSMPLAMAWFEYQVARDMYKPEQALKRGTLFPELDKPWLVGKGGQ